MRWAWIVIVLLLAARPGFAEPQRSLFFDTFEFHGVPARVAFAAWSTRTGVPLVVNWPALEQAGIDPDQPITIALRKVHAAVVLDLLMRACTSDGLTELVLDPQPGFLELLTKEQALRRPIVRVYDVRDLLMEIPSFTDAPSFNLSDALSNTSSGGGGLFDDREGGDAERPLTRQQRGEQLAQLIRDTIEPGIWIENGGAYASIRYFDGRLIVRAPRYVQGLVGQNTGNAGIAGSAGN